MALSLIGVGTTANDGTGDPLRTAFQTVNTALTAVNNAVVVGTGSTVFKDDSGTNGITAFADGTVGFGTSTTSFPGYGNTNLGFGVGAIIAGSVDAAPSYIANRNTSDGAVFAFYREGVAKGTISVTTTAVAYNTSSDERLKKDIVPSGDALSFLRDVPVDSFVWKSNDEQVFYGYIAQKLAADAPYAVTPGETDADMWSVDHSKMVPALHRAIQQLEARIVALEA